MAEHRGESDDVGAGARGVPSGSSSEVLIDFVSLNTVHWLRDLGSCHLTVVEPGCCYCCCSGILLCSTLCDPMDCSTPGFPVHHQLLELAQTHVHGISAVMPSNHLILCHPLLLPPSIFPSIRVFSSELALCIRWPKYWRFSFSISPSKDYSGLQMICKLAPLWPGS